MNPGALLEAQFDSALDGILIVDSEGKRVRQNQQMIDLWGIPADIAEEKDDRREFDWVTKRVKNRQSFVDRLAHIYEHPDELSRDEVELTNGRWLERCSAPVYDQDGKYDGRIVTFRDITERKRAEEALRQSEERLRLITNLVPLGIFAKDAAGRHIFANPALAEIAGFSIEEMLGKTDFDLVSKPAEAEAYRADDLAVIRSGSKLVRAEEPRTDLSGRTRFLQTIKIPFTLAETGEPAVLGVCMDITERKQLELQFLRAQRMESIGTLAGGIAHDLNNILAPILMSIQLLKDWSDRPEAAGILATIEANAKRGADIVRQVLSFARGLEGQRLEVQLEQVLRDVENIVKNTFPKDIRVWFSLAPETWTVLGDATQLHQILLNLCVNARDAMPNGGDLNIHVENCLLDEHYVGMNISAPPGRYVGINVTDSGMGIPPDILGKIFEPFFTTKGPNQGSGLGLSTVMAIVKSHHGAINVCSEPGKGTTFQVYLPALETAADAWRQQSEPDDLPRGKGETVLVVDDEAPILSVASQTLEAFGYRVLTATDGAHALEVYFQSQPEIALVLTDMMMPVMDGPALIHALLRRNRKIKIVGASGLNSNVDTAKLSGTGVKHLLMKPYSAETLLKTVRKALDAP